MSLRNVAFLQCRSIQLKPFPELHPCRFFSSKSLWLSWHLPSFQNKKSGSHSIGQWPLLRKKCDSFPEEDVQYTVQTHAKKTRAHLLRPKHLVSHSLHREQWQSYLFIGVGVISHRGKLCKWCSTSPHAPVLKKLQKRIRCSRELGGHTGVGRRPREQQVLTRPQGSPLAGSTTQREIKLDSATYWGHTRWMATSKDSKKIICKHDYVKWR